MIEYLSQFKLIWLSIMASLCAGLATGIGSIPIFFTRKISKKLLALLLGAAAGAMLFVISHEIIPGTHQQGHSKLATHALLVGFVVMMFLDSTLG